jgi:uncharacterized protein (TIGR02996 family)
VTQDEAFIRTIVESPGDDTPRLAYADWLDEQSDSRGAYLRAETEWARPFRGGRRPDVPAKLEEQTSGLNPVWVARISRPPMGVCCDHIEMWGKYSAVTEQDIAEFEREHHLTLTPDYRAFLLNHNGRRPRESRFVDFADGSAQDISLYQLCHDEPDDRGWSCLRGTQEYGETARALFAIGDTGHTERQLLLDLALPARGELLIFAPYVTDPVRMLAGDWDGPLRVLAPSFAAFLNVVYTRKAG